MLRMYWADNGIKWRAMPHDFPPWSTVYDYYRRWVKTGVWSKINHQLVKLVRLSEGREEEPSLTIIDSQSVKTVEKSAPPALRFPQRKDGASRG